MSPGAYDWAFGPKVEPSAVKSRPSASRASCETDIGQTETRDGLRKQRHQCFQLSRTSKMTLTRYADSPGWMKFRLLRGEGLRKWQANWKRFSVVFDNATLALVLELVATFRWTIRSWFLAVSISWPWGDKTQDLTG